MDELSERGMRQREVTDRVDVDFPRYKEERLELIFCHWVSEGREGGEGEREAFPFPHSHIPSVPPPSPS